MEKLEIFLFTTMALCLFSLGFISSKIIDQNDILGDLERSMTVTLIPMSEQEIINTCKNLSLKESAKCLRNEIKLFFIYNSTDDSLELTLSDIKSRGGDCRNYAFLYERLGKGIGFESETRARSGEEDVFPGHRTAFIWDDKIYCELDMLNVKCRERLNNDR